MLARSLEVSEIQLCESVADAGDEKAPNEFGAPESWPANWTDSRSVTASLLH